MELEGDLPVARPPERPEPVGIKGIHVTPDNVVALAAVFNTCAKLLGPEVAGIEIDLRIKFPWLHDPASIWAQAEFNKYFADGEHSFAKIVKAEHDQHRAMADALVSTARQYGLTEQLVAAGLIEAGQPR